MMRQQCPRYVQSGRRWMTAESIVGRLVGTRFHGVFWLFPESKPSQIARFMRPTWGPPGADRTQVGPWWPHEPCYQRCNGHHVCVWSICLCTNIPQLSLRLSIKGPCEIIKPDRNIWLYRNDFPINPKHYVYGSRHVGLVGVENR